MNNKKIAVSWLGKASDDFLWTKANLKEGVYYGACFTAQQTAEKALKAFLYLKGKIPHKIHDLGALVEECINIDKSFESLHEIVLPLVDYYTQTRYPDVGELINYTKEKAEDALARAKEVLEFVRKKLS